MSLSRNTQDLNLEITQIIVVTDDKLKKREEIFDMLENNIGEINDKVKDKIQIMNINSIKLRDLLLSNKSCFSIKKIPIVLIKFTDNFGLFSVKILSSL